MKTWEIEKLFKDDIREKKKTGSGAFHMRGKGVRHGFNGALRTPYHFMKTKEKNKLNGEVECFNMYETIIPWNEFDLKDKDQQKVLLTRWRELYPNQKIMDELGEGMGRKFNTQSFADLVNSLGCPPKQKGGSQPRAYKPRKAKTVAIDPPITKEEAQETIKEVREVMLLTKGLHLEYNGEYNSEQLTKIFTKLQLITDGEENKFVLSISITERI
jgi:hypothetical protein